MQVLSNINRTHPSPANIAHYRRELDHSPQGPADHHSTSAFSATTGQFETGSTLIQSDPPAALSTGSMRRPPIHSRSMNGDSYGPRPSHSQEPARCGACDYEQPPPYHPESLKCPRPMPATISRSEYAEYLIPPNISVYQSVQGQSLYIDNFQPPEDKPKTKTRRTGLSSEQTDIMNAWYENHLKHPFPTKEEKHMIMQATGLTKNQVGHSSLLEHLKNPN